MGFWGAIFGSKTNEAAQHQLSADILLQQHQAITDILKEITSGTSDLEELGYFASFIASHVYLVGAMTAGMRQDDTHYIVDWYMHDQFKNPNDFSRAVARHEMYIPAFHAAAHNDVAYTRLAAQFLSYANDDDYGVKAAQIGAWLSSTLQPAMLRISQLLKGAGHIK